MFADFLLEHAAKTVEKVSTVKRRQVLNLRDMKASLQFMLKVLGYYFPPRALRVPRGNNILSGT